MSDKQKTYNNVSKGASGIRIISVAAFCFAIVSWYATAEGLNDSVFHSLWQAGLISFGIQSILFVFNLKLPKYISEIGKNSRNFKIIKSKNATWPQFIICIFYAALLLCSSFFSFAFISNNIYKDTLYQDMNIVLDDKYRDVLFECDSYIAEYLKANQLVINKTLADLQGFVDSQEEQVSLDELENQLNDAKGTLKEKRNILTNKETKYNSAKVRYNDAREARYYYVEEYNSAKEAYDTAENEYNVASSDVVVAEKAVEELEREIAEQKNNMAYLVRNILAESLSQNKELSTLEKYIKDINNVVVNDRNDNINSEKYTEIVVAVQELNLAVENHKLLQDILENKDKDKTDLATLKENILTDQAIIPNIYSDAFEKDLLKWKNSWINKYYELNKIIKSLPTFSKNNINLFYNSSVVNVELLEKYDPSEISEQINDLIRKDVYNINIFERAWNLLFGEYPFLAILALGLSLFVDVSSLSAGLFIFYIGKKKENKDDNNNSEEEKK